VLALKKLVGFAMAPMTLALFVAAVALVLLAFRSRRSAVWLGSIAIGFAYLAATPLVGDVLLRPLESTYPPARLEELPPQIRNVVVLGYSYTPAESLPITAAVSGDGLARIVEGIRLTHRLAGARLIVSGGAPAGQTPSAYGYSVLARELNVSDASIVVIDHPLDTASEAREVFALLGDTPFVLVTSAYHMPRSMRLMNRAGARPIPAPTGHKVFPSQSRSVHDFIPSSVGLRNTELAFHEYLGLAAIGLGLD
jgi:uncharacterized SAM-binding protein YcdF (DUF218 family)